MSKLMPLSCVPVSFPFEVSAALNYQCWSVEAGAIIAAETNALAVQGMWHSAGSCRFLPRSV
jgi:hypothetical protein